MRLIRMNRPETWDWAPLDKFSTLRNEISRLLQNPLAEFGTSEAFNTWAPAVDLYEDKDNLIATVELPGLKKEDIDVSLHEENLVISGERKEEKQYGEGENSRAERFYGRFQRSIALPKKVDVNGIKAAYNDGILTVTLPKAPEAKPRQIEVNVN